MASLEREFARPIVKPPRYEKTLLDVTDRRGWEYARAEDYIHITGGKRSVRHRLRGLARDVHSARVQQSFVRGDKL